MPRSSNPASMLRSGGALSLLTLLSRVLGLLREITKAAFLGTSALSDAFSVAFLVPNLFRRLFAEGSIAVAFIPTLKQYLVEDDRAKIREFVSCVFTFLTFFVSLVVVAGIVLCPLLIRLFGMEIDKTPLFDVTSVFDETVFLTRIMFPFLAFISVAALFQGILNSIHIFAPSGLAPILLNIVTIGCAYVLSPFTQNPARAMAIGIVIGGFLEAAIQFPFVWKHGFRFCAVGIRRAITNPGTGAVLRLIGPTIIGMAAYQLNDLTCTALAGQAGEGIVSSLQYSLRLQELILGVFAVSIGTVLLPNLAEYAKSLRWKEYNERLSQAMDIVALIAIPVTFFFLAQGDKIIRLLFQTRSFDENSVALTYAAFLFHVPGLFFIALNRVLAPAFYAKSDSKSPTLAGVLSFGINIVLALVLARTMKGSGIALALTISSAVNTALLLFFPGRQPIAAGRSLLARAGYAVKLLVFSVIAALPVLFTNTFFNSWNLSGGRIIRVGLPLALQALLFAATGICLLLVTGDKHLKALRRMVAKKR
ncbi:MAG: murein biosynthesis integral membrane protein MurJ [Treponema sp.]|jgi:putative peptidoglycan lipid II flippase|nr:murein biosynthesis integral membrane protein MurJ [Treponema sp.]